MNPSLASSDTGSYTTKTAAASISIEVQISATATLTYTSTPSACTQPANNTLTCYPSFYAIPACAVSTMSQITTRSQTDDNRIQRECIATAIEWQPCSSRDHSCICAHSRDIQMRAIPCGEKQCSQADRQSWCSTITKPWRIARLTTSIATIDYYLKFCVDHGFLLQSSSSSSISPSSSSSLSLTNSTSPGTFSTSTTASPVPSSSSPANAGASGLSQGAIVGIAFGGFGAMTIILLIAIFFILFRQREGRRRRQPPTTQPEKGMTLNHPSKRAAPLQPLSPTFTRFAGSPTPSMHMRATSLSSPSALITPLPSPILPTLPPRSPLRDVQLSFPTPPAATRIAQPPPWPFRHPSVQSRIHDRPYRPIHEIDGRSLRNQDGIWSDDLIDEGDSLWRGYDDHYVHHRHDDEDGDGAGSFLRRNSMSSSAVLEGRTTV